MGNFGKSFVRGLYPFIRSTSSMVSNDILERGRSERYNKEYAARREIDETIYQKRKDAEKKAREEKQKALEDKIRSEEDTVNSLLKGGVGTPEEQTIAFNRLTKASQDKVKSGLSFRKMITPKENTPKFRYDKKLKYIHKIDTKTGKLIPTQNINPLYEEKDMGEPPDKSTKDWFKYYTNLSNRLDEYSASEDYYKKTVNSYTAEDRDPDSPYYEDYVANNEALRKVEAEKEITRKRIIDMANNSFSYGDKQIVDAIEKGVADFTYNKEALGEYLIKSYEKNIDAFNMDEIKVLMHKYKAQYGIVLTQSRAWEEFLSKIKAEADAN